MTIITLFSQGGDKKELNFNYKQFNSIIYISGGFALYSGSKKFFGQYQVALGGIKSDFEIYPVIAAGSKFQFWQSFRTGFDIELSYAQMNDNYTQKLERFSEGFRSISQTIQVASAPILLIFEYIPLQTQFRTYTGIGLGFVYSDINWNELLTSTDPYDKRHGGEHYKESEIYPAGKIYTGLELGFDKFDNENFLGSFIIELKYSVFFRKAALFDGIREQFTVKPSGLSESNYLIPGYIALYFGLTFNFNRR